MLAKERKSVSQKKEFSKWQWLKISTTGKKENALVGTIRFPSEPSVEVQAVNNSNIIWEVFTMAGYN